MQEPFAWMVGGPQGSGVDTAANLFARACALAGLHVFGKREYYSNIMGKHSYFQVRVHPEQPVRASNNAVHLLTTFDVETPFRHARTIQKNGGLIYDPGLVNESVDSPPNMEARVKSELKGFLDEHNRPNTLEGLLQIVEESGVRLFPVPYEDLFKQLGEALGLSDYKRLSKTRNTIAVAASLALTGFQKEYLFRTLEIHFKSRTKIVEMNRKVVEMVYRYIEETVEEPFDGHVEPVQGDPPPRLYIQGTQATALGKIVGGIGIQSYYPISPATDESVYLESHENVPLSRSTDRNGGHAHGGVVVVQTEDEIAAITMATGAAIGGARASTATSGPGFCLMVEGIGWAGINDVPVVITVYQRGGPSTGLPTRTEQGDLSFIVYNGHGEAPRIVLASGDHEECFYDAVHAFNLAECYQVPVIHLLDKYLANSTSTVPVFDLSGIRLDRGKLLDDQAIARDYADRPFLRFEVTEDAVSPRTRPGQPGGIHWMTGDEHDEEGHITEDVVHRQDQMDKRMRKMERVLEDLPVDMKYHFYGNPEADTLILSWGSNKGVILEVLDQFRKEGHELAFLQVRLLWPFDRDLFRTILQRYKTIIDVEVNYSGQLADLVQAETCTPIRHRILKYNGRPIMFAELTDAIQTVFKTSQTKVVLTHGI